MTKKAEVYPFVCELIGKEGAIKVQVMKVSARSILLNTGSLPLLVNSAFHVKFVLPFVNQLIEVETVVFKTYDAFKGKHNVLQPGSHVVELVFKNLGDHPRRYIASFLGYVQLNSL